MQFTYHNNAGDKSLKIDGDLHKYLFKIRRQDSTENIYFRNLKDNNIYEYQISNISRRDTLLTLISSEQKIIEPYRDLHIGWCIIDTKEVEKNIALLNEIGVNKITFISCQFTQKKYKINFEKLEKLLQNSSSQCGRSNIIELSSCGSLDEFIKTNPNTYMFNFSSNNINNIKQDIKTIVIGCEGGFSQDELSKFSEEKIVGCNINAILKSQTAVVSVASIVLS